MTEKTEDQTAAAAGADTRHMMQRAIDLVGLAAEKNDEIAKEVRHWRHQLMLELKRLGGRNPGPHIGAMEKTAATIDKHAEERDAARDELRALAKRTVEQLLEGIGMGSPLEAIGTIPAGDLVVRPVVKDPAGRTGTIVSVNNADGTAVIGYPDGTTAVHLQEEVRDTNGQPLNFNADPHE